MTRFHDTVLISLRALDIDGLEGRAGLLTVVGRGNGLSLRALQVREEMD